MSGVATVAVSGDEAGVRLDRWFKRHYPQLGHGRLEKLLRTGQVRVDGKRAKANFRLEAGQNVRVPPLSQEEQAPSAPRPKTAVNEAEIADLRARVLHRDRDVLVLNKPPGLPVQGGSKVVRHLDAMLDGLRFDGGERPRLVHRLDKDTSGVLLLARNAAAAAKLTAAFREKSTRKIYWALVAGVPKPRQGRIDAPLDKRPGAGGETVQVVEGGQRAVTYYSVVETAARRACWLALMPVTGRTHQLRVHCTVLGTPVVGDGKYGGAEAFLSGAVSRKMHLHAREIAVPHPAGGILRVRAPLPEHMLASWRLLDFDPDDTEDHFAELEI